MVLIYTRCANVKPKLLYSYLIFKFYIKFLSKVIKFMFKFYLVYTHKNVQHNTCSNIQHLIQHVTHNDKSNIYRQYKSHSQIHNTKITVM